MRINNECKNPPWALRWQLKRALRWIHYGDLEALNWINLIDDLPPAKETSPTWYKKATKETHGVGGWYKPQDNTPPCITLNIRIIYRGVPRLYWLLPIPTLLIARTLAHEVAHHLIARRGYACPDDRRKARIKKDEEMAADRYAYTVNMTMRRRWYYRFAAWAIKHLSEWHYNHGMLAWKGAKYGEAAEHWFSASMLDPSNRQAWYGYARAKEQCEPKTR
jgi:hypothetical protein